MEDLRGVSRSSKSVFVNEKGSNGILFIAALENLLRESRFSSWIRFTVHDIQLERLLNDKRHRESRVEIDFANDLVVNAKIGQRAIQHWTRFERAYVSCAFLRFYVRRQEAPAVFIIRHVLARCTEPVVQQDVVITR